MSYHGYAQLCKKHLIGLDRPPQVLEVGIDRGVMTMILNSFLVRSCPEFTYVGVDVLVQEQVAIMLRNNDATEKQRTFMVQGNSIDVLPELVKQGATFDLILLDGDHNYHTVSKELPHMDALLAEGGALIIDDYSGKWSERDMWYAERPGYEAVDLASKPVTTEKHGVKPAVDEWLAAHSGFSATQPIPGEPVLIVRSEPPAQSEGPTINMLKV